MALVIGLHRPMTYLYLNRPYPASSFTYKSSPFTPSISKFKAFHNLNKTLRKKKINRGICRAEFSADAPLAAAIGACMLSSLLLPAVDTEEEDGGGSVIDAGDTRFAAMGIISFIPYFNWLSWVFAWLDTGKRRYAVYSIVYLAPYIRSNLSLSPEDGWLPIASILFCIVHVQLEASLRNGDLQGFQMFSEAAKHLSWSRRDKDTHSKGNKEPEVRKKGHRNLPDADEQSRNEIRRLGIPEKPSEHHERSNGDWEEDGSEN